MTCPNSSLTSCDVRLLADDPNHTTDPMRAHEEVGYLLDFWCLL